MLYQSEKKSPLCGDFYCKYSASSQNAKQIQHKEQGKADQIYQADDCQQIHHRREFMFFVLFDQPVVKPGEDRRGEEGGNHREFQQFGEGAVEPQNQCQAGGRCPQYPGEQFARAEVFATLYQPHRFGDCARVAVNDGNGRAEHAGEGDEANQRSRPFANGFGVHADELRHI